MQEAHEADAVVVVVSFLLFVVGGVLAGLALVLHRHDADYLLPPRRRAAEKS